MTSIGGVDLGEVTTESSNLNANLFVQALPLSAEDETLLLDLFGTSRTINVSGQKTGTVAELRTFIENIEALINGDQSGMTFVSSWTNDNKTVLIADFTHDKTEADENRVKYTITLIQGSVL